MEGYTMYLHLIDEGSRYQLWYGQRAKEETVAKLKNFRDMVSAKHQKLVRTFHSDRGTEIMNDAMAEQCADESIQIFTHPHSPEEVCLIEKAHGTLMDKVRAVLFSSGLPGILWGEAACYVIETINRTSTKGNVDKVTPHEKVFGSKPSVRHLRPFGCLAMKFVDKVYRKSKLSMKGAPALMVGYATQTKGYRLLDMTTGVISEHRHENVKFYEETTVDRWYVEKLLNEVYRLRRRPSLDSSKLPLVQLPVVDVDESHAERGTGLRSTEEVEMSPAEANSDNQEQEASEPVQTSESEESLEDKPPPPRKRHLPVEVKSPRRSKRARKRSTRLKDFVASVLSSSASATATMKIQVPKSWKEMMASAQRSKWLEATKEEFLAQQENETWILVPRPKNAHILKCRWLWTLKENDLRMLRFKARLVVLGCFEIWGIDFDETFAPVVRFETLRLVFLWAGRTKSVVKQFDFVTAFLNAPTERVIFMEQPQGFVKRGFEDYVCLLKKSIYGLRQAPRNWNNTLHKVLVEFGFRQSYKDEGLYWIRIEGRLVLLPLYVDDILLVGKEEDVDFVDKELTNRFKMKCLGDVNYLLGLQIQYDPETHVSFRQTKYIQDIMAKFNMESAYP
ncbi:hypothetical protein PR003_g14232 [Phytophthora rubi]|uniref:Integrase catalytic domain-containing protein n=1 Tax=Phytophthora rubi TaxID=129364 RepID=A0A6A4EV52_9STRA|nr:hypothetical protein PR003_g14232 [Phytophthora rubi]